jgi:hypothetical protein
MGIQGEEKTEHIGTICMCKHTFEDPVKLVGSNIKNKDAITIQVNTGTREIKHDQEKIYAQDEIVEFYITHEHFIKLLINNVALDIPITIISKNGKEVKWAVDNHSTIDDKSKEMHDYIKKNYSSVNKSIILAKSILDNKKLTAKDRDNIYGILQDIYSKLNLNIHDTIDNFKSYSESIVQEVTFETSRLEQIQTKRLNQEDIND